jgi:hypothetical protein
MAKGPALLEIIIILDDNQFTAHSVSGEGGLWDWIKTRSDSGRHDMRGLCVRMCVVGTAARLEQ